MKAAIVLCVLSLLLLTSNVNSQCVIASAVSSFDASCQVNTGAGCTLSASIISSLNASLACLASVLTSGVNLVIAPTGSGALTLSLDSSISYTSLTVTANPGVALTAIASTATAIQQDLVITGAATFKVASGTVVTVGNNVNVAAQATLNVAGNVTAATAVTVAGTIYFAGNNVNSSAQTAWVVLTNTASQIKVSGSAGASAYIRGNGGFDGSVALSVNATVAAGNSPGTVYVNGDLDMDASTTLEIDVDGDLDYDRLIIKNQFHRDGTLYVKFENGYNPSNGDVYVFASHSSSSGSFIVTHGNYLDSTFTRVHAEYGDLTTSAKYSSASSLAASLLFIVVCAFMVL